MDETPRNARSLVWFGSLAVCMACSGGSGTGDDDGAADGQPSAPDAAVDGGPVGSVHVTTYSRCCTAPPRTRAAGVTVHVIRPDGTLANTVVTGADGEVTIDSVADGSAVMAVYTETPSSSVATTVLGVSPGDALVLGDDYPGQDLTTGGGDVTITYPPFTAHDKYLLQPCDRSGPIGPSPVTLYLDEDCQRPSATIPIFAFDSNYDIVGSAVLRDVNFAIGQSLTVSAWSPPIVQAARATVPAEAEIVELGIVWRYPEIKTGQVVTAALSGGTATGSFSGPDGVDDVGVSARLYRGGFGEQKHGQTFAAGTALAEVAIAELPWIGAEVTSPSEQRIQWIQDGTGGDAVTVTIRYDHLDPVTGTEQGVTWTVIAPVGESELSWANFPIEVPAPRGDDSVGYTDLLVADLGNAASYDELRAAPEWQVRCPLCSFETGELSAASSAVTGDGGPN